MKGLYIHIPFCVRKCSYCDFYSLPNRQSSIAGYVQAVLQEARSYTKNTPPSSLRAKRGNLGRRGIRPLIPNWSSLPRDVGESRVRGDFALSFQTLYIGGGTPSLLGPQNLQTLITGLILASSPLRGEDEGEGVPFSHCEQSAAISGKGGNLSVESTLEANPESASPEFLQTAKNLGFNRLSFGVQSLADAELHSVGRIHTATQAVAAIKLAPKTGFQNISADLIIGLPAQTWTTSTTRWIPSQTSDCRTSLSTASRWKPALPWP